MVLSSPLQRWCAFTFTSSTEFIPDLNILLRKTPVKVGKEAKFLGLIFDIKLTFKNHVQQLKSSCQKALDILRVVGHTDWGTNHIILLCLHCALVHSKLDYGCIVSGSACKLVLRQLDLIHHQGFCIALGAFHTSPVQSLYMEAHKPSQAFHCLRIAVNYILKLKSVLANPACSDVFEPENVFFSFFFEESALKMPPLGMCILPYLEKSKINLNLINDASCLDITLGCFQTLQSGLT